jgi:hypothetical protein
MIGVWTPEESIRQLPAPERLRDKTMEDEM